jgi:acetyl-CoA carboxylase alpha subunit
MDSEQVEKERGRIKPSMPGGGMPVSIDNGGSIREIKKCTNLKARIKLRKLTPEEKAAKRRELLQVLKMELASLTPKLIERLRPYVKAKHPGKKDDPETIAFVTNIRREAEKLRTEHFGAEVCQSS